MRKLLGYMIVGSLLTLTSGLAISSVVVNHTHKGTTVISHEAPLDSNGCHVGADGFHCH